jgi:hypothetical protein
MAYVIYQDHTIVSSAIYDQVSGKWMFDAYFTSDENGSLPQLHLIPDSPELFSRFEDAEAAGMESAKNWVDLKRRAEPVVRTSSGCAEQPDQRDECMQPMATPEYRATIKLQEAILHVTSLGYQLRTTVDASRKNIAHSRELIKETKIIFEQSRSVILASQRLRQGFTSPMTRFRS